MKAGKPDEHYHPRGGQCQKPTTSSSVFLNRPCATAGSGHTAFPGGVTWCYAMNARALWVWPGFMIKGQLPAATQSYQQALACAQRLQADALAALAQKRLVTFARAGGTGYNSEH
jgi:hypothetical protein